MTTKKKSSKAKSKNTAKKQILTPVAEEPIAEQVIETSLENSEPMAKTPTEQVKPAKQNFQNG